MTTTQPAEVPSQTIERLQAEIAALQASRDYYRDLFEEAPVALMAEDFSDVKASLDQLRAKGVQDFQAYFDKNPEAVMQHYDLIKKEVTINKAFVDLYKAESKEQLLNELDNITLDELYAASFKQLFITLAHGETRYSLIGDEFALDGSPLKCAITWTIAFGYEDTWSRIIVAATSLPQNQKELM